MRVAAAAYPLEWQDGLAAWAAKMAAWVAEAAGRGAELLVFPEYGLMELASLGGAEVAGDLERALAEVARHRAAAEAVLADLAIRHRLTLLGPSGPAWEAGPRPVNRATLFGPAGPLGHQDKQIMTRFEREEWRVVPGGPLAPLDAPGVRLGVTICYDAEFPLLARALAEAGALLLLVPSCTEALAGFTRVRVGAMARALENQFVAVHAPTVGECPWCPAVDRNTGRAALYGPPDRGFPETGILAETALNAPGWAVADVPLEAIRAVRRDGAVLNHAHWPEQHIRLRVGPGAGEAPLPP